MTKPTPVIGITTYAVYADWTAWHSQSVLTPRTYVDRVAAAGGIPLLLPPQIHTVGAVERVVHMVDAVMLVGGEDLCARWSGRSETLAEHERHSDERDAFEVALAQAMWVADKPLLGICRGAQVLNVSRGGTLIEDLPSAGASDVHLLSRGTFNSHPVTYDEKYLAKGLYDPDGVVPSHHHQAIDVLGEGLVVTGRAEDGVVEAVEGIDRQFVIGVQWHPEEGQDVRLFEALVAAGRETS